MSASAVPPAVATPRRSAGSWVLWPVLAIAGMALWYLLGPERARYLPSCGLHRLTGLYCPGCGTTRALQALLHGRLLVALHCNALFTLALPGAAALGLWRWRAKRMGRLGSAWDWRPAWTWWLLAVLLVFGVARNLPLYPFNLLAP